MSDNITNQTSVEDYDESQDEFSIEDFGFVVGPDGELKSIVYPEHLMDDPPDEILAILEIFGIDSIHMLEGRTLH
jgi:hypothetical protein